MWVLYTEDHVVQPRRTLSEVMHDLHYVRKGVVQRDQCLVVPVRQTDDGIVLLLQRIRLPRAIREDRSSDE